MSYQLDATIHNTQWVTGHFHLIYGGAIVIMYFAIAYDLWPHLTGRALTDLGLMRAQLWLWFVGMVVTTFPWHWVGILGMPRRMAYFDYGDPALWADAVPVALSAIGGFILLASGILFLAVLVRGQRAPVVETEPYRFADRGPSTRRRARRAERLWPLDRADGRPDNHQLRLSDCATCPSAGRRGSCRLHWGSAMSQEAPLSLRDPWVVRSVAVVAAIFVAAVILGFMVFPLVQPNAQASRIYGRQFAARRASCVSRPAKSR